MSLQVHPEGCDSIANEARENSQIHNTTVTGMDAANIALIVSLGVTLLINAAAIMAVIWSVVEVKEARASIQYYERAFKACLK